MPPTRPEAAAGFVIMEQVEYVPMSGTNTIAVATVLIETGMVPSQEPITNLVLEAPAGPNGTVVTMIDIVAIAVGVAVPRRRREAGMRDSGPESDMGVAVSVLAAFV